MVVRPFAPLALTQCLPFGPSSTPVAAVGPVDQHSQLQLFLDGPGGALFTLIGVDTAGKGPVRLILHFGTERAEDKGASPTFTGDPDGLLTWHSNIRASLALPQAAELAAKRDAILELIRAWLAEP